MTEFKRNTKGIPKCMYACSFDTLPLAAEDNRHKKRDSLEKLACLKSIHCE